MRGSHSCDELGGGPQRGHARVGHGDRAQVPALGLAHHHEERRARDVRAGARVGPGKGVQPVGDGHLQQPVIRRVVLDLVDAVAVAVVGAQDRLVLVREPAPLGGLAAGDLPSARARSAAQPPPSRSTASIRTRSCSNTLYGSSGGTWLTTSCVGAERVRCGSATAMPPQLYRRRYPCAQGIGAAAEIKRMPPDGSTAFMLRGLIDGGGLHSAYQPIVDIRSLAVVGLRGARPRAGGIAARIAGRAVRRRAPRRPGRGARPRLPRGRDPGCLGQRARRHDRAVREHRAGRSRTASCSATSRSTRSARAACGSSSRSRSAPSRRARRSCSRRSSGSGRAGVGVALDDVGADDRSLALMPFLRPDVVKLDLRLIQDEPTAKVGRTVNAINAEAERTGAVVLAEGIETDAHLFRAQAVGAQLGQGWLFGRPGPLPVSVPEPLDAEIPVVHGTPHPPSASDAFHPRDGSAPVPARGQEAPAAPVAPARGTRRGDRSRGGGARDLPAPPVLHGASRRRVTVTCRAALAFVGVFGEEVDQHPAPGVRGADLHGRSDLAREWNVLVLGPHFAGGFVARDLGDEGPDEARRFDFAMTFDRDLVSAAASLLMQQRQPQRRRPRLNPP